jgi:hypothetical protein
MMTSPQNTAAGVAPLTYPSKYQPREALSGVLRASSGNNNNDSKVASAKYAEYASGCKPDDHKSLPLLVPSAPGTKCTDKWNLKTAIRQFDKGEKEFGKGIQIALEAYIT